MCSTGSAWTLLQAGCPIRKSTDQRLLPTSRRLSQVAASFFGSWCLGIHLGPLVACPTYNHSSGTEVLRSISGSVQRIHCSDAPGGTPDNCFRLSIRKISCD